MHFCPPGRSGDVAPVFAGFDMIRALSHRSLGSPVRAVVSAVLVAGFSTASVQAEPQAETIRVSQPSAIADDSRDQQLMAAERAILEGLSARAIGAFDNEVAVAKAPKAPPQKKAEPSKSPQAQGPQSAPAVAAVVSEKQPVAPSAPPAAKAAVNTAPPTQPKAPAVDQGTARLASENEKLKREVVAKGERVVALERELELVRGQLASAEIELSRISSIKDPNARASLKRYPAPPSTESTAPKGGDESAVKAKPVQAPAALHEPLPSADLQIATVSVPKVDLRVGPGKEHSPLMQLSKGARLAVEARKGDWYRVFAPNGQRAWVSAAQVTFGGSSPEGQSSTVRVRGYSSSLEDAAFQRIQSMTGEK
jgi:hypothetical protein